MDNKPTHKERQKIEYQELVKSKVPKNKLSKNCIFAFIVGGLICVIGQFFSDILISRGLSRDEASAYVTIIMIFLGAFLTGIGVYDKIGKHAGAGSIVPITGFANSIVSSAMEYKKEGYVFGMAAKMFIIAGPVLVYGIISSIIVGLLFYLIK